MFALRSGGFIPWRISILCALPADSNEPTIRSEVAKSIPSFQFVAGGSPGGGEAAHQVFDLASTMLGILSFSARSIFPTSALLSLLDVATMNGRYRQATLDC